MREKIARAKENGRKLGLVLLGVAIGISYYHAITQYVALASFTR
jgi:hypothetical protein